MHSNRTGTGGRRSRNAETTRAAILHAAVSQFAEEGFANASIDRIAGEAQVTKGAVYHHFKDKAKLFEAAFVAVEDGFLERLEAGTSGVDDSRKLLAMGVDLFLASCRDATFLRIAVLEAPAALGWERWKELEGHYLLGFVSTALAGLSGGDTDSVPADLVVAAASAAGCELSSVSASRSTAERHHLGALIMRMVDGITA
jgi:AcrR family transcriptional regulator